VYSIYNEETTTKLLLQKALEYLTDTRADMQLKNENTDLITKWINFFNKQAY
jgi:hypothetical protein